MYVKIGQGHVGKGTPKGPISMIPNTLTLPMVITRGLGVADSVCVVFDSMAISHAAGCGSMAASPLPAAAQPVEPGKVIFSI